MLKTNKQKSSGFFNRYNNDKTDLKKCRPRQFFINDK